MGPLQGIRVLDVSSVIMAPFAARVLGDMGADVIKVEPPSGDTVRAIGPMKHPGMGAMYLHTNRNKRSIALDLKSPAGHDAFLELVKTADVLLYNVRPRAMARLNLAYEQLRAINEKLIYVGTCGFDQSGPYAARPAFDDLIQGLSAIPSLVAIVGDGKPRYIPLAIADRYVGLSAVNAVLGALVHRGNSGRGQSIEVPMFETMVELVMADHSSGAGFDPPLGPPGYLRSLSPERYPFETKDGFICAMIYTTQQWSNFFDLTGGEMRNDERFASLTSRTVHASFVHQHLQSVLRAQTTVEWLNEFETRDIPAAILHTLDSLPHDPHLVATGFFEWREHHTEGKVRHTRPPSTWSETPLGIWRDAPNVGEHSEEILREIGLKDESIAQMMNNGSTCSPARRAQMLDQDAGQAASRRRNAN